MTTTAFVGPFPTDFSKPDGCTNFSSDTLIAADVESTCLPKNFNTDRNAYYSPGTACPSGYTAQHSCARSTDTTSTTITCCPVRSDLLTMWCVDNPSTLSSAWENMDCTWSAGTSTTVILVTTTSDNTEKTIATTMSGDAGVNAYGLRMVYEASDLTGTKTGASTGTHLPATTSSTSSGNNSSSGGLSTGAIVAIAVVIPVVAIAAALASFFWYRKRKQRYGAVKTHDPSITTASEMPSNFTGTSYQSTTGHAMAEVPPQELPSNYSIQELSGDVPHQGGQAG